MITSPAAGLSIVEKRARVAVSAGDSDSEMSIGHGDIDWYVGSVGVSSSELTPEVVSPAANGSVIEECARVDHFGGDCGGGESVGSPYIGWC